MGVFWIGVVDGLVGLMDVFKDGCVLEYRPNPPKFHRIIIDDF